MSQDAPLMLGYIWAAVPRVLGVVPVCLPGHDDTIATLACRSAGFVSGQAVFTSMGFPAVSRLDAPVIINSLACPEKAKSIADCKAKIVGSGLGQCKSIAAVLCKFGVPPPPPPSPRPPPPPSPNPRSPSPPPPLPNPPRAPPPNPKPPSPKPPTPNPPSPSPPLPSPPSPAPPYPPPPSPPPPSPPSPPPKPPSPPHPPPPSPNTWGTPVEAVFTGGRHTCAVAARALKCWGSNANGELGLGDKSNRGDAPGEMAAALPPVDVGGGLAASVVAPATSATCALLQPGGVVKCWGVRGAGVEQQGGGFAGLGPTWVDPCCVGNNPEEMGSALPVLQLGEGLTAVQLVGGSTHWCALLQPGGTIKCWGGNSRGQLGRGDTTAVYPLKGDVAAAAVNLGTGVTASAVFAGVDNTCAITQPGSVVKCWGNNDDNQLGLDGNAQPSRARIGDAAAEMGDALPSYDLGAWGSAEYLAMGDTLTCALLQSGEVVCWGINTDNRLGLDLDRREAEVKILLGDPEAGPTAPGTVAMGPVDLGSNLTATALAAGRGHVCALLQPGGRVKCWGSSSLEGELGLGDPTPRFAPGTMGNALPFVDLGPGLAASQITAHESVTCALLQPGGVVKCWGFNRWGQLGQGDTFSRGSLPSDMGPRLLGLELGPWMPIVHPPSPPPPPPSPPPPPPVAENVASLVAGRQHTCALVAGRIKCWGDNVFGQLGLGDIDNRGDEPGEMGPGLPWADLGPDLVADAVVANHRRAGTCALFGGRAKCWGSNDNAELGMTTAFPVGIFRTDLGSNLTFMDLGSGLAVAQLAAGKTHVCALLQPGGVVKCWGASNNGALGSGGTATIGAVAGEMGDGLRPLDLGTSLAAVQLVSGEDHSCALLEPGPIVKCWGLNRNGQLGYGDTEDRGDQPGEMGDALPAVDLGSGLTPLALAAGGEHTCALLAPGGVVKCWGFNSYGQLGLGDRNSRGDAPGEMGDALPGVSLGAGVEVEAVIASDHTCALLKGGSVKCWGFNLYGQLGLGDKDNRGDAPGEMGDSLVPLDLGEGNTATQVALGWLHTCALLQPGGNVKCWGRNSNGQLGLGDARDRGTTPADSPANLPYIVIT
ncbi:hypothetical protein HYH03_004221 [Edaphochlamys debaryana]|uniref:SRCR domain-containing protein n=1 Tax=Edaphochlamys debaryana TaxID=47281 RepID=A0A835YFU5_9CHLO|nr:hypothetical protein HYH03_004221 [Edaphochlamys debaryana]|eukprot:KAG2497960.1 hypothetical protein HYH03_004221 [Edaphochlamys debaryana]